MPTVLNAANEIAVEGFLAGRIGFLRIAGMVEEACDWASSRDWKAPSSIEEALAIDSETRRWSAEHVAAGLRFGRAPERRTA